MATRLPQDASALVGSNLTFFAATVTTGDATTGGAGVVLLLNNGSGSSINVTITTPEVVEGTLAVGDRIIAVPATTYAAIPITSRYNDPATGLATFVCSAVTTVTFAVFRTTVSG